LTIENKLLNEAIRLLRLDKYGPKFEKLSDTQLALLDLEPGVAREEVTDEAPLPAHLPSVEETMPLPAEQRQCATCGWQSLVKGWEGSESQLQGTGWTRKRRTVVLRRKQEKAVVPQKALRLLEEHGVQVVREPEYEYVVLVTDLVENLRTILLH
jgi:hypothetical protein